MAPFTFRNIDCGVMEKVWASEAEKAGSNTNLCHLSSITFHKFFKTSLHNIIFICKWSWGG